MLTRCCLAAAVCAVAAPVFAQAPPPGADVVPTNAFAVVTVKVSDLWDAESLKPARDLFTQGEKPIAREIAVATGLEPGEIERVTMFWPILPTGGPAEQALVVLTTRKPYNEARLLKALKATSRPEYLGADGPPIPFPQGSKAIAPKFEAKIAPPPIEKKCGDNSEADEPSAGPTPVGEVFFLPGNAIQAIYLLDDRNILFAPAFHKAAANMVALVGQLLKRKTDGPLAEALHLAGKHTFVAAARVDQAVPAVAVELPAVAVPFRALLKAKTLLVTADVAAKADVTVRLTFPGAADARRADPVLRTLIQMVSEQLTELRKVAEKDEATAGVVVPLLELAVKALDAAEVKTDGAAVAARAEIEIGPAVTKAMAAVPAVIGDSSDRVRTQNNLKQIGLALHNYHDANGHFPTDVVDENGKPILSWRAQILPYIEQEPLYRQLDLKKSWDDPTNKAVLGQMPNVFEVYGREAKQGMTFFQMFTAPKALEGGRPFLVPGLKTRITEITDGTSNTFMVVEAADPVIWLKPGDLPFDPKNLPKLGSPTRGRFQALFGDGSVREFKRAKLTDDTLRALITINGGEVIALPD